MDSVYTHALPRAWSQEDTMSWMRTLLGIMTLMTLLGVAHAPAVLASGIEVRSGPGGAYEVIATVPPGGSYVLLAREPDWCKIELPDGRVGWVLHIECPQGAGHTDSGC